MSEPSRRSLARQARSLRELALQLLRLADEFTRSIDVQGDEERSPSKVGATRTSAPVETDRRTFSVSWNHRVCPLGNGLEFRVMEWLARRPGHYQQVTDLLEEVWGAPRSRTAVRTVISNLRSRLRRAGMGDLASRIDGHCQGHYRLALPANHVPGERTDRKQTATRPKADSSVRAFGGEAHEAR